MNVTGANERYSSLLERYFPKAEQVICTNNTRLVVASKEVADDEKKVNIYSTAVFNGYKKEGAGYKYKVKQILLDGVNLLMSGIERDILNIEPVSRKDIVTVLDDDDNYIAQRYGSIIVLAMNIDDLTIPALDKILEYTGLKALSKDEQTLNNLLRLGNRLILQKKANAESNKKASEKGMNDAIMLYRSSYDKFIESEMMLGGVTSEDEAKKALKKGLERLMRSPDVESIEIGSNMIVVTTTPLKIGPWNIGQYEIKYAVDRGMPSFRRLSLPNSDETVVDTKGGTYNKVYSTPYITTDKDSYCPGNWEKELQAFWTNDLLMGVNYAINYLRSYHEQGGPACRIEQWLVSTGYLEDAKKLYDAGCDIHDVEDGDRFVTNQGSWITKNFVEKFGLTGKLSSPEEVRKHIEAMKATSTDFKLVKTWEVARRG